MRTDVQKLIGLLPLPIPTGTSSRKTLHAVHNQLERGNWSSPNIPHTLLLLFAHMGFEIKEQKLSGLEFSVRH